MRRTCVASIVAVALSIPVLTLATAADDLIGALKVPGESASVTATTTVQTQTTAQAPQSRDAQIAALQKLVAELTKTLADLLAKKAVDADAARATLALSRDLSRGSRGEDVRQLQIFLISQNLLASDSATGFFGSLTEKAVKEYQTKNNIVSAGAPATTGYGAVGPKTRASMQRIVNSEQRSENSQQTPPPVITSEGEEGDRGGVTVSQPETSNRPPATSCSPLPQENRTAECPAGQTGSITQTRTSSCAAGAASPGWNSWQTSANNCTASIPTQVSITEYANFTNACHAIVTGNQSTPPPAIAYPLWEHFSEQCTTANRDHPILFSVTHEKSTSHDGAANNIPNAAAYMGDYNYTQDFGRRINYGFTNDPARDYLIGMALDTLNYRGTDITGWNVNEGNIFFGFNDMSIEPTSLDKNIVVEFDIRVRGNDVGGLETYGGYSGHNIGASTIVKWKENAARTNTTHYFGVILDQTPGYVDSWHFRDLPLCHDVDYVGCWYDPDGKYNEGRNIDYQQYISSSFKPENLDGMNPSIGDGWQHVRIPMSALIKQLGWASPPASWADATFEAMTFGIESTGATRYWLEVKNYQVYYSNS